MKHDLHALNITSACRPEHNVASGFERNDPLLLDEVAAAADEPVGGRHERQPLGLVEEAFAEVRVRDLDQCHGPLAHGFAEQVGNPELGHHIVHIRSCQRDPFTCEKGRPDAGLFAVVRRRSQANDRLAPARCGGAAVKVGLSGDAAIELAAELVGADLARQIDDEGLGQRRHFVVLRHHFWIGDILDRPKLK